MEEVAGDNSENKILCIITKMKPVFIFIIIIAIVAVYFIFFKENKNNTTETYVKCVNDTTTKNKSGLLGIPCLFVGSTLEETNAYMNNLNDFIKGRNTVVSDSEQKDIQNIIKITDIAKFTSEEASAVTTDNLQFVLKSIPFFNSWDGIQKNFYIITNDTPSKYIAPDNIKVVINGLQKQIFNTNKYLNTMYEYIGKLDKIPDSVALTTATFISTYIYLNNIYNFIQTH